MTACEKAALRCNKAQYNEATFLEKVKLSLHLLVCRACAKNTKNNNRLTHLCKKAHLASLDAKEKKEMKKKLFDNR